jgi:probable HAF family extracellular repeat protein/autotransporter-associated beta strand protein
MINLGTLGGNQTVATSINASGQIIGTSLDSSGYSYPFLYANGQMTEITALGVNVLGRNINTSGQIEGNLTNGHLFVLTNGQVADLGIPFGGSLCKGYGFNDSGEITGQVKLPSGVVHGFLYNPVNGGSFADIGTLSGSATDTSYGSSVNASGQVEGDSNTGSGTIHAFVWYNSQFTDIGTLGGPDSSGVHVNNLGHATGTAQLPGSGQTQATYLSHIFFFNGTIHDCGTLGGNYANANSMNNHDQIVGYSYLADEVTTDAFLYSSGTLSDLNSLVLANSGWRLTSAQGINDSGQIIANGVNTTTGAKEAFLLNPVATPGYIWNTQSGSWASSANWLSQSVPGAPGVQAVINLPTAVPITITLDGSQIVGTLTLGNTNNATGYTLVPGTSGSLTMDNSGSAAQIYVTGGSHSITANVTLNGSLVVTPTAGTALQISGDIGVGLAGAGLTLNGPGELILSGSNTFGGGTTVYEGTLLVVSVNSLPSSSNLNIGAAAAQDFGPSAAVPVPEPSTLVLAIFGLWSAMACRRFLRRTRAE